MTFSELTSTYSTRIGAIVRRFTHAADGQVDQRFDPYERAPLGREEVERLFELERGREVKSAVARSAAEQGEYQALSRIRSALYSFE